MSEKDFKVYARYFIGLLLLILLVVCLSSIRFLFLPLIFGGLGAIVLVPVNNKLLDWLKNKNISAFLPVMSVFVGLVVLVYICTLPLLASAKSFIVSLPTRLMFLQSRLGISRIFSMLGISDMLSDSMNVVLSDVFSITGIMEFLGGAIKWLYVVLLTPIFAFYILRDRRIGINWLNYMLPSMERKKIYRLCKEIYDGITMYIYGYMFISILSASASLIAFSVIGLDSFVFLSFFMGVCSFIPFVGPFIGGVPAVIVAFGQGWKFWYVLTVIIFISQGTTTVLMPKTIGNSANVHPIFGILAMIVGYGFFGIGGIILAVPVFVIVRPIMKYIFSYFLTK